MNLISKTHHSCERNENVFIILQEYTIISSYSNYFDCHSCVLDACLFIVHFEERKSKGEGF